MLALARSGIDISAYRSVVPQLGGHHRLLFQVRADSQRHQSGRECSELFAPISHEAETGEAEQLLSNFYLRFNPRVV